MSQTMAELVVDPAFRVGPIDRRLGGSFVEHLGRCVYGGIWDPDDPAADTKGFRSDVAELVRELGVPVVRYPGGNFVSGYRFEDGIGPPEDRPRRLDLAWRCVESNRFGTDEALAWCSETGTEAMLAVNLGTRGALAAADLVEYTNHPGGTYWSERRVANGHPDPYGVKLWCLGNEMDGPWQLGHRPAADYAKDALQAARAMRAVDPTIELVACGSSNSAMPSFPSWEATVLDVCYDDIDYISLHSYYGRPYTERGAYLASAIDMDRFIETVVATCDHVGAAHRSTKRIGLSFDEWNVWHRDREPEHEPWQQAPPMLENRYDLDDAVVVGTLVNSLLRHADRVKVACLAQLVNVIAPIVAEPGRPAWRQSIFWPYRDLIRYGEGDSIRVSLSTPEHDVAGLGSVPVLDVAATVSVDGDELRLLVANRSPERSVSTTIDLSAWPDYALVSHDQLTGSAPLPTGAPGWPPPVAATLPAERSGKVEVSIPALSWNTIVARRRR
jgi:alpha-N-arabinofuranosidase